MTNSYILNRGWIDPNDAPEEMKPKKAKPEVSEYAEERPEAGSSNPWGTLDEEDDFDDKADEFENTYNFRFEEP
jgi:protein KRI1